MAGRAWESHEEANLEKMFLENLSVAEMSNLLDRSHHAIKLKLRQLGHSVLAREVLSNLAASTIVEGKVPNKEFTAVQPPSANRPIVEILEDRRKESARKKAHHEGKNGIDVFLDETLPYGILIFGDLHADDPGCDIDLAMSHMALASSEPGVYAINIGDISNNWIGSLARLYGKQATTDDESHSLVEWVMDSAPWIYTCLGNHDVWSPMCAYIAKRKGLVYSSHGAKVNVHSGDTVIKINARHDFKGRSMYNPAQGSLVQNYRGSPCDVIVAGHTHVSAYTLIRNGVSEKKAHCIRVGSYKTYDDFAESKNFTPDTIGPCAFLTIDTEKQCEDNADRIRVWEDPQDGVEYLRFLRSRCTRTNPSKT